MTGTSKFAWGLILACGGFALFALGSYLDRHLCPRTQSTRHSYDPGRYSAAYLGGFQGQLRKQQETIAAGRGIRENAKGPDKQL